MSTFLAIGQAPSSGVTADPSFQALRAMIVSVFTSLPVSATA
ncbi:hypothetical protein ABIB54_000813, partial [Frigoribacterium sp. UYMn621]